MSDTPKDDEADKRRDELARRVLKMPPKPRKTKPETKPANKEPRRTRQGSKASQQD